jgi:hypothetical protein
MKLKYIIKGALISVLAITMLVVSAWGQTIEETYSDSGPFEVSKVTDSNYQIFYPNEMRGDHSIITWGNAASGVPNMYIGLLRHFASWGFVVVATNSRKSSGDLLIKGVDLLEAKNNDPKSVFYNQLDLDFVGAAGHSLGGGGAIRAGNDDPRIKVICPISAAPVDSTQQEGSMFIVGGSKDRIVNENRLNRIYDNSDLPTFLGILAGAKHFRIMGNGRDMCGYVTAWFMAELQKDAYAQDAFYGNCEICDHPAWDVKRKNID